MSIGKAIKILRIKSGRSQKHLAEEIDCSPNYLSLIENDRREPSLPLIRQIANSFKIPVELLLISSYAASEAILDEETKLIRKIQDLILDLQILRMDANEKIEEELKKT